jgi:hypothetical protein
MDQKREGFALWFDRLKDPYEAGVQQTPESLHERQIVALQEAFGLDSTTFDAQWAEWALDHYPKK